MSVVPHTFLATDLEAFQEYLRSWQTSEWFHVCLHEVSGIPEDYPCLVTIVDDHGTLGKLKVMWSKI